jgi:hypothetical protein
MSSLTKACRWCERGRDTPNPLRKQDGDFLKFVSGQNTCNVCRYVLILGYPTDQKNALHCAVTKPPHPRRQEFMEAVVAWEKAHNESDNGVVRYRDYRMAYQQNLDSKVSDEFTVEETVGNLWRPETYEAFFNRKPATDAKMTTVSHKGQRVSGYLMNPEMGWAPGVLKLTQSTTASLNLTTELGSTRDELRQGQMEDMRKSQLAEMRVDAQFNPDGTASLKRKATSLTIGLTGAGSDDEDSAFQCRFVPRLAGASDLHNEEILPMSKHFQLQFWFQHSQFCFIAFSVQFGLRGSHI